MAVHKQKQQRDMALDYLNTAEGIAGQGPDSDFLLNLLHRMDRQQLAEVAGLSLETVNDLLAPPTAAPDTRKLDIELCRAALPFATSTATTTWAARSKFSKR
ncbi:hypothetical protein BOC46_23730 [Burkholderia pseudomallei]|nr:hypothetical protein BK015_25030 [Burkholderia pseudomallei]ARK43004.1 hypothetical protein BOC60_22380 [Burkholderia pseudomallei]ARK58773.1 hypothetical protein BOC37_01235 [Burkholderia pseudomallei]ARL18507.1 hypothetical protein BOC46_23730 [Burkholderia pseudomallei]RIV65973.1 hypothetical protein D2W72_22200 [Burkholderia pseudomallei]